MKRPSITFALVLIIAGLLTLAAGTYNGLITAPSEWHMGDVQRIMYVHVPTAWASMLILTWAFGCSCMYLFTGRWSWDHRLEAAIEVSLVLSALLCAQGSIWAKPTWGVWWDWDPRLTTVAVLVMAFAAITALRYFVDEPVKRATWTAVATVAGYVDVPIVFFSVKWWNSLHQQQSTVSSISREFLIPLMINFAGMMLLVIGFLMVRTKTAALRLHEELAPLPPGVEIATEVMA